MEYQKTLNLPKTDFPMKANLSQQEPKRLEQWQKNDLYQQIRDKSHDKDKYILHDGPPYANGNIHLGHALNKILKDIIIKIKTMAGKDAPYIPGWDCHGLPIEHQVVKKLGKKAKETPRHIVRSLCREYADNFVGIQKKEFERLGVLADYDNPYLTMSPDYEAKIVEVFGELFNKGFIYRGKKPIYWSPTTVTALAEAEIEYFDIESPSIYVKFPVKQDSLPSQISGIHKEKTFVVIWTTTPWTLPANLAVCFHPDFSYCAYNSGDETYIIAEGLARQFFEKTNKSADDYQKISKENIEQLQVTHPFINRPSQVVFGRHVTLETGTGVVHTAPGHGQEDYIVGLEYGLDPYCPVDEYGKFTKDYPEMQGEFVFKANNQIIELMTQNDSLLAHETITHSYPHGWRDKKPVIFRATEQWFLKIDHENMRDNGQKAIDQTKWIPPWGEKRIRGMVEKRPDWCLSRQRAWGVPIPAFRHKQSQTTYISRESIEHFAKIIREQGLDSWFTKQAHELLPETVECCGKTYTGDERIGQFEQEQDILDVWFDSGVSSFAVADSREELGWPTDLYLEGSDQHRGWFQSSLWPALALRQQAPYRQVLTHGFLLDENGRAMSKSEGNVIAPDKVIQQYGVDILRLWVSSEDYQNDIKLGWGLLGQIADSYRKIRNSYRFMLGNLYDYQAGDYSLSSLDKWALYRLGKMSQKVQKAYHNFEFHQVYHTLNNFFNQDLSAVYFDIVKDILYVDSANSDRRRAVQNTLDIILDHSVRIIAPVLCFTADEIFETYKPGQGSIHLQEFLAIPEEWLNNNDAMEMEKIMEIRAQAQNALEALRNEKIIGKSLEAEIEIFTQKDELKKILNHYKDSLAEFLLVSKVQLVETKITDNDEKLKVYTAENIVIGARKASGQKCPRCWYMKDDIGSNAKHPEICGRCANIVENIFN